MPQQSPSQTATSQQDYVLVPRQPTPEMVKAGWYEAHDENPMGVWRDMIEAWESTLKERKLSEG